MPKLAAVVAALALLLAACSDDNAGAPGGRAGNGSGSSNTTASTGPSQVIASSDMQQGGGTSATAAPGDDTPAPSAQELAELPADWIAGKPADRNPDDPMILNCTMQRGETCRIRVQGFYRLTNHPSGHITAAVYEDESATPAQTAGQGLPVPKGASRWYLYLPYRVSATAQFITVVATLTGPGGEVLHEGERHTYRIP